VGSVGGGGDEQPQRGKGGGEVSGTLSTFGFSLPDEIATTRVDTFERAYPQVQVKITEGGFDEQQFLSAVASGSPPDLVYVDPGDHRHLRRPDQLGAFPMEDWYLNVLAEASPDVDITVTPFKDRQGNPITFVTGSAWAIPKGAKNPNAACRLARTMTEASTARHGGLDERLQAPQGWQEHVEPVGVAGALGLQRPPPLVLPDQPPKRGG
jgi:ABC-type glycerol-3-phosphate transport system substrate-binding protein